MSLEKKELNAKELIEILSHVEHERWANWQKYLHSLCVKNEDGSLTIPKSRVDHWKKEISTPYSELPENIKEFDRHEARITVQALKENNYSIYNSGNSTRGT